MPTRSFLQISARQLASQVRARQVSAREVVEAHIDRAVAADMRVNALAAGRFAAAREEARRLDELSEEELQQLPLAGVPFTVKEMISVADMPHTFGCVQRAGRTAQRDAAVVARLRRAGAIVLGVTNVPEWGMWFETYNPIYGRTSNPYDTRHTCGGSSGGEGALVGAGASAFGVGTDIGGSVRMPAAFCGVYGHKPSHGLLPLTGTWPVYAGGDGPQHRDAPYLTLGFLTRSAGDLHALLSVASGVDSADPNSRALTLGDPERVGWRGRRVLLLAEPHVRLARAPTPAVAAAVRTAGETLEAQGAIVEEAPADLLRNAGDAWFASLQSVGGPSFAELLGGGERVHVLRSFAAALLGRSRYSWPALYFLAGERIGRRSARTLARALSERDRLRQRLHDLLGADGVLVLPAHPRVAPHHGHAVLRPFDFLLTAAFNALRMPATVAPAGFDADGLPLSVQFAAADGNDHLTIAAAAVLEQAQATWTPAPIGDPALAAPDGGRPPAAA